MIWRETKNQLKDVQNKYGFRTKRLSIHKTSGDGFPLVYVILN